MHKKDVLTAPPCWLGSLEKQTLLNSVINVCAAVALLPGKPVTTASTAVSTGLDCGLPSAILSDGCASSLVIVRPHLTALRITGLKRDLRNKMIIPG